MHADGKDAPNRWSQLLPREEAVDVHGLVKQALPEALFRVMLDNGAVITAHAAGKLRVRGICIVAGDRVTVEVWPADASRGRIKSRHNNMVAPAPHVASRPAFRQRRR